jgi:hypothetical protein
MISSARGRSDGGIVSRSSWALVPSIYSVRLLNVERSAGLIDDGRHDPPHPHRPPPRDQDPPRLVLENLALRHQLAVLQRSAPRLRLRRSDRLLWVRLSRLWSGWSDGVSIVQPATVIRWQRSGFKLFWTWKSRRHGPGRPAVAPEIRALIRRMSQANPPWGAPRIHGELQKLGVEISQAAVSKYVVRHRRPPSQTWRTLLDNHLGTLSPWTFSSCPPCCSRSCSSSWSWRTSGGASSTSTYHRHPHRPVDR